MRADRLLALVLLLRQRGRMSAAALARELEVSTRTVLRDVEALSAAGVPVYAERGRAGGFALLPGWSTDLTGLTLDEARALLVAGSRPGVGPELGSAMRKVVAALPAAQRDVAADAAQRVLVRPERMLASVAVDDRGADERLRAVQRGVLAGRRLRLRYAARGEEPRWRVVDPVGLVEAGGRWYLLADRDGQERSYRLSRVLEVAETGEPATRRPVDLEQAWEQRRERFRASLPRITVRVRVRAHRRAALAAVATGVVDDPVDDGAPSASSFPEARGSGAHGSERCGAQAEDRGRAEASGAEAEDRGRAEAAGGERRPSGAAEWVVARAEFGDVRHATAVLWSLSPDVEALDPPELRAALAERAAATAALHGATIR